MSDSNNSSSWYELVKIGDQLDQGDILFDCPIVEVDESAIWPMPLEEVPSAIFKADVIVITQTCDLTQGKTPNIIVCRHASISELNFGKGRQKEIVSGRREREYMLEECNFGKRPMERRVVNLGEIYSLPIDFARRIAASQNPRLRLLPPYREHLSQAFARFFMRVGLPQDIRID